MSFSQVPPVDHKGAMERMADIEANNSAGALSNARYELERELVTTSSYRKRADLIFSIAQTALRDHRYEESYQWSTTYLSEYPHDLRRLKMLFYRGVSAYQTERLDTAVADLNRFLFNALSDPDHGEAFYWRGLCEIEQGEWQAGEADFQSAFSDSLGNVRRDEALVGWSLALERRGDLSGAKEKLNQMMAEFPRSDYAMDARLRLASLSLQQRESQEALTYLSDLDLKYRSQREEALLLRAEANAQIGEYAVAIREFNGYLKEYPGSDFQTKARYGLAWAYLKDHNPDDARHQFDTLGMANDTTAIGALYQSGAVALLSGKTTEATASFSRLLDKSPYDYEADKSYYQMAMQSYREKRYRDARRNFEMVARLFPESPLRLPAYRMLGESDIALGDYSNAQFAFGQVRRLNAPDSLLAPSMFREGVCLYYAGRFSSSADRLQQFLDKYSSNNRVPEAYAWRGEALYQDGKYEEAEQSYAEALRRSPDKAMGVEASYGVAWALFEQKKFTQAAAAFDRFATQNPSSDHALDALLRKADCY
ncbi:MAG TPA: tetratricopeptide repeat protein, partial [Bacteroidota bacterium]|nr:tetratricopeptide repeat protein [Bacteroidota bacterium]